MKSVILIKTDVKRYRLTTYAAMTSELAKQGIELRIYYTSANSIEQAKGDATNLNTFFGEYYKAFKLFNSRILIYNIALRELLRPDLVILVQSNANVMNLPIIYLRKLLGKKTALWGHSRNFQGQHNNKFINALFEAYRQHVNNSPDYWFSYTDLTTNDLIERGFNLEKIKTINNSVEITNRWHDYHSINGKEPISILFCGALYKAKRIDFIIQLAIVLKKHPVEFIISGDGPEFSSIKRMIKDEKLENITLTGRIEGDQKDHLFKQADFTIIPGLVGLGIIDSFAYGLPLLTLKSGNHSPEISYFEHNVNGIYLKDDVEDAACQILDLISDPVRYAEMSQHSRSCYHKFSHDDFIQNIVAGVSTCLER